MRHEGPKVRSAKREARRAREGKAGATSEDARHSSRIFGILRPLRSSWSPQCDPERSGPPGPPRAAALLRVLCVSGHTGWVCIRAARHGMPRPARSRLDRGTSQLRLSHSAHTTLLGHPGSRKVPADSMDPDLWLVPVSWSCSGRITLGVCRDYDGGGPPRASPVPVSQFTCRAVERRGVALGPDSTKSSVEQMVLSVLVALDQNLVSDRLSLRSDMRTAERVDL